MPWGHRPLWPSTLAAIDVGRRAQRAVDRQHAGREPLEQHGVVRGNVEVTATALRVRQRERERARRGAAGRDRSARAPPPCRDRRATPVAKQRRTDAPGGSRTRCRRLRIGSRTTPVVPDRARAVERDRVRRPPRPRPMNRARSVSHSTGPCARPSRLTTCIAHMPALPRVARPPMAEQRRALRRGTRSRRTACRTPGARNRRSADPSTTSA